MVPIALLPTLLVMSFFLSAGSSETNVKLVPALYIFGDSTIDGGNSQNAPPYGVDLINTTAVPIRCTNGLTTADFIATFLGLPLVPPYRNTCQTGTSTTGVNFGYAGSGILKETGPDGWTFGDQVAKFNSTVVDSLSKLVDNVQQHLRESVILVSFGINDYNFNLFLPNNRTYKTLDPDTFAKVLLNELAAHLTTLYQIGARKFMVYNIWPLGCVPMFNINQSAPLVNCCNEKVNQILIPYNVSLPSVLEKLQSSLPGSVFSYSDDFHFVRDLKENPQNYGITNTTGSCVSSSLALGGGLVPCVDRNKYLYYDAVHTTQAANYAFSLNCFNGTLCSPKNIIHLAGAQVY